MSSLLPPLLHWLHEYGYPVLWLTVLIAAVGVPLPIGLVLLAVGAFFARLRIRSLLGGKRQLAHCIFGVCLDAVPGHSPGQALAKKPYNRDKERKHWRTRARGPLLL